MNTTQAVEYFRKYEGVVPHMYLDVVGLPPTSPFHRGVGHSVAVSCVLTGLASQRIDAWQAWLREEAARFRCLQYVTVDPLLRAFYGICHVLICLVSGALVGFLAGWGSHLALDFGSVRSLPLI